MLRQRQSGQRIWKLHLYVNLPTSGNLLYYYPTVRAYYQLKLVLPTWSRCGEKPSQAGQVAGQAQAERDPLLRVQQVSCYYCRLSLAGLSGLWFSVVSSLLACDSFMTQIFNIPEIGLVTILVGLWFATCFCFDCDTTLNGIILACDTILSDLWLACDTPRMVFWSNRSTLPIGLGLDCEAPFSGLGFVIT